MCGVIFMLGIHWRTGNVLSFLILGICVEDKEIND